MPLVQDRFEAVNQAYEFLCSRNVWTGDGPNANNIVLILRTQTILFNRYSDGESRVLLGLDRLSEFELMNE